ncbi:MAG: PASTA domain-containing protein [Longimicrobiales bacterium]
MDLGSSIRRRRQSLGAATGGPGPLDAERMKGGLAGLGRLALFLLAGFGIGYLVATVFVFPAPAPPPGLKGVPDLRGKNLNAAMAAISDSGLVVGTVDSVRHPTVASGQVLGQSPLPGRTALPGAELRVTLSLGPEVRPVPDVTRLRGDRATVVLSSSGFAVAIDTVDSRSPAGRVVGVQPSPGTEMSLPGRVVLTVSRGPPPFAMPDLIGVDEEAARQTLEALGLVIAEVQTRLTLRNDGEVLDQSPAADSIVEMGSAVRLIVGEALNRRRRR